MQSNAERQGLPGAGDERPCYIDVDAIQEDLVHEDRRFEQFARSIRTVGSTWYCYVGHGLVHMIALFLRFIPDHVNLAFIGGGLDADERAILSEYHRPVFYLDRAVDPNALYEMMFRTEMQAFGWIDLDCLVINSDWFREIELRLSENVAMSGPFSYGPIPLRGTPFALFHPAAIRDINDAVGVPTSPCSYSYEVTSAGRDAPGFMCRLITAEHDALLHSVLAFTGLRIPYPQEGIVDVYHDGTEIKSLDRSANSSRDGVAYVVFSPLVLYQLMALATGKRIDQFRALPGNKAATAEVVHPGRIAYWTGAGPLRNLDGSLSWAGWAAAFDALALDQFVRSGHAPTAYEVRFHDLVRRLQHLGMSPGSLAREIGLRLRAAGVASSDERWTPLLDTREEPRL